MKAIRSEGGVVQNVTFENIQLRSVGLLLSLNMDFHHEGVPSKNPPVYENIYFRNITGFVSALR
jgi:hypothetical protein